MIKTGIMDSDININPLKELEIANKSDSNIYIDKSSKIAYKIPDKGHSDSVSINGLSISYNYESEELELSDEEDIIYSKFINPTEWLSNPNECIRNLLKL